MRRRHLLRLALATALTTLAAGSIAVPAHAARTPVDGPSIMVIGGTITARTTNDPGSASQGWWSMVAGKIGATSVTRSAEINSSMSARGNKCAGTSFASRLSAVRKVDVLVVESGTDNFRICNAYGKYASLDPKARTAQIKSYVKRLGRRVDQLHMARHRVFVIAPWGSNSGKRGAQIRQVLAKDSRAAGFRYIATPQLGNWQTIDRTLPNVKGHRAIRDQVLTAIGSVVAAPRRADTPHSGPTIHVVGDSITAWFNDEPGSRSQGWWSILGRGMDARTLTTSAEGGSGMNVRGNACNGTTFGQRLPRLTATDVLVIEGGRNDYKSCTPENRTIVLSPDQQVAGVNTYMDALLARVTALGMSATQVYVVTPWGTRDRERGDLLQAAIESAATARGFTYVRTPVLGDSITIDGVHPTRQGNLSLAAIMRAALEPPAPPA